MKSRHTFIANKKNMAAIVLHTIKLINDKLPTVLLLRGQLGSGKTFFTRELLSIMGVNPKEVTSPTFSIIHTYSIAGFGKVSHVDLYRVKNITELYNIGFEEILLEQLCIIEWPDIAIQLLQNMHIINIDFEYIEKQKSSKVITKQVGKTDEKRAISIY